MRLFSEEHPEIDKEWYQVSNYLGLLSVKDENALQALILKLRSNDIKVSIFCEPDIANQVTAIVIEPCNLARKLLSNIPNALKETSCSQLINKHTYNNEQIRTID